MEKCFHFSWSRIAELYRRWIFNFMRNCQTFSEWVYSCIPTSNIWEFQLFHVLFTSWLWPFFFLLKKFFLLKDNCFTEFCDFMSYINRNQSWVHPCPLPSETPSQLPPHPNLLDCHRAPIWVSFVIQQIPIGYLFNIWYCKFPCYSLHTPHCLPLPLPLSPQVCSLDLFFHCCPENKFISTIFF